MWIQEFHRKFGEITQLHFGRQQDLSALEQEVAQCWGKGPLGFQELCTIEESGAWDYPNWWPKLSSNRTKPIGLPANLTSMEGNRRIVQDLQDRLKHIEVVSVLLRFVFPDEFGILSPPVAMLLALPYQKDHVEYYLRYVQVLKVFTKHYEGIQRVADVDMALWGAAHGLECYPSLLDEMYRDEFFQEVRLANLLDGLGRHWQRTSAGRMLFARSFLKTDYEIAAAVTAKVYETLVHEVATSLGIKSPILKVGQTRTGALVDRLARQKKIEGLQADPKDFKRWWELRCNAVHEVGEKGLTQAEAGKFVHEIHDLASRVAGWAQSAF